MITRSALQVDGLMLYSVTYSCGTIAYSVEIYESQSVSEEDLR